jgi:hypothetical protein
MIEYMLAALTWGLFIVLIAAPAIIMTVAALIDG